MRWIPALLCLVLAGCGDGEPTRMPADGGTAPGPPPLAIRGVVLDTDENPIAGAVVTARLAAGGVGADAIEGISDMTDAKGEFALDVEGRLKPQRDAPVQIVFEADGYVMFQYSLKSFKPGVGQNLTLTLDPAGDLSGNVVDGEGEPVADAFVYAILPDRGGVNDAAEVIHARTAGDGTWRLKNLPVEKLDVIVMADGFVPARSQDHLPVHGTVGTVPPFVLAPGKAISGRVVTPDGDPVAQARVRVWKSEDFRDYRYPGRPSFEKFGGLVETDADGRFSVTGLPPGKYVVDTSRIGHIPVDARRDGVEPGAPEIEFRLRPDLDMELLVLDAETGRPVTRFRLVITVLAGPGAVVNAQGLPVRTEEMNVANSPGGSVKFSVTEDAVYGLEVLAPGYTLERKQVGPITPESSRVKKIPLNPRK